MRQKSANFRPQLSLSLMSGRAQSASSFTAAVATEAPREPLFLRSKRCSTCITHAFYLKRGRLINYLDLF